MDIVDHYIAETLDILTYNGNVVDIQINYGMLVMSLCCWCMTVLMFFNKIRDFCWFTAACLYILFTVQVVSCLVLHCMGISGVWCAMVGFAYRTWLHSPSSKNYMNILIVICTYLSYLWANVYYFKMEGSWTTIAHIIATWLGYEANKIWFKAHEKRAETHKQQQLQKSK